MKLRTIRFKNYDEAMLIIDSLNAVGVQCHAIYGEIDEIFAGYVVCDRVVLFSEYVEVERIEEGEEEEFKENACVWFYHNGKKEYYRIIG